LFYWNADSDKLIEEIGLFKEMKWGFDSSKKRIKHDSIQFD